MSELPILCSQFPNPGLGPAPDANGLKVILSPHFKKRLRCREACNITMAPLQVASEFGKKQLWGKLNKTLTCPARQVMFWPKSNLTFV